MSLRFCMLTTFFPPYHFGGDAIGIQRLCHGLVRRGHEVTVVHDRDAWRMLSGQPDPAPVRHPDGLEAIGLESRLGRLSELLTQQLGRPVMHARRLERILEEGRFDVVVFHNVSLIGGPGLLRYGSGVKLYLAHEHWLVCPMHVLWRHGRELCTGRECLRCTLNHGRPPQLWRSTGFLERELHHVDRFVAMSEFSRDKHHEFGFPREMEVLPYFLPDPPEGEPAELPAPTSARPQERPYFLFVGRLEKIKGLDDVIPAFRERPDVDLVIAGDGNHGAALRAQAEGLPNVRFLGMCAPADLVCWYEHALALVVPSVCFETFGIILIEAFSRRTPVLARRIGPFPEIVECAGAGVLFSDHAELCAALDRFPADPAWRDRLAANGRAAYLEHWSESAVVPRFLQLVQRCAEEKGDAALARRAAEAASTPTPAP